MLLCYVMLCYMSTKMKIRTTIYLDSAIQKEFRKVCDREGVSMSQKVESMIARHVAVHMKGNPQLRLETFFGDVEKKCFRCEGIYPSLHKVEFISGLIKGVCSECLKTDRERGVVKRVCGVL